MRSLPKNSMTKIWEDILMIGSMTILILSVVIMGVAAFDDQTRGEAPIGSFESFEFNDGWMLVTEDSQTEITLPTTVDAKPGDEITIINTVPDNIEDGMNLMFRASMEDARIFVGGKLRAKYASENIKDMSFYIPSANLVAELKSEDVGKEIKIRLVVKTTGVIRGVRIGYGNNVWFDVLNKGLFVNAMAITVLLIGLIIFISTLFLGNTFGLGAARMLSIMMINTALWVFSESTLRQLIFKRPSLSQYFAYFLVELIAAFACMYFDEIQHRLYHKRYLILETLVFLQIIVNIALHFSGIMELYRTITFSHIWMGVCAAVGITHMIIDAVEKRLGSYRIIAIGMLIFVALAGCELVAFYANRFHIFGAYMCLGLLVLMTATIIQIVYDDLRTHKDREKNQTSMTISTIETIASAIDARDEYTGGHSERVGFYAERLAREMAADYDLTEEDILRVHYIGLVHDIGKIGVADDVLNKSGRLNDEEFSLMKKHTEIGYEIMNSLDTGINGLLDGIRYHHERFDGKGYPDGLSDTDIPLIARVLALADSYDAMTSNRVYRKRLTDEEVRAEIKKCSGTQFDPALAAIFLRLLEKGELSAVTIDGVATDIRGKVMTSSVLESKLQRDLLDGVAVLNPTHVRMLCYIIKLMEKKGKDYQVVFVGLPDNEEASDASERTARWDTIRDIIKKHTKVHDVNIRYTDHMNVLALYDKTDEQTAEFTDRLKDDASDIEIFLLRKN